MALVCTRISAHRMYVAFAHRRLTTEYPSYIFAKSPPMNFNTTGRRNAAHISHNPDPSHHALFAEICMITTSR